MRIVKAGAFVLSGDRWVFVFGPPESGDRLGVVRLGGHREGDETAWECACREVREEASVSITPLPVPTTYWTDSATRLLSPGSWPAGEVRPLLVIRHRHASAPESTVLYLAATHDLPAPSSETKGLLLPTEAELHRVVRQRPTLAQYLAAGGKAIRRIPMDESLPLAPSFHLQLLTVLLRRHPDLGVLPEAL